MRKGISAAQGPEVPGACTGNILGMYYENHCNVYVGLKGMCIYIHIYIYMFVPPEHRIAWKSQWQYYDYKVSIKGVRGCAGLKGRSYPSNGASTREEHGISLLYVCSFTGDILPQGWRIKWERKWKLLEYYAGLKVISYPGDGESNGKENGSY